MTEQNAARVSLRTAAILTVFTVVFTTLMAATYQATKPAIDASAEAEKMKLVGEVLPAALYDNALLTDRVGVAPRAELGLVAQDENSPEFGKRIGKLLYASGDLGFVEQDLQPSHHGVSMRDSSC